MISYKLMPGVVKDWKEALFMGYFGPIGAGAVFYAEHGRHLFPELGKGDEQETNLARAIGPVVYWLVLFSIVVHGLSIPALNLIYTYMGVKPIQEDAVEIRRISMPQAMPNNAVAGGRDPLSPIIASAGPFSIPRRCPCPQMMPSPILVRCSLTTQSYATS
ncbi:hypothetical protein J3459_007937 [Metarhizium acridum]|uniref:uncharacterized protein n=1 Tax=Metarhizium acridum TaxID=92637 RepID=UPI001C6ACF72|nr:hypothetical protein J3458_018955 [Metarhizium acridum]KAG8426666.1 hypothetical protein J3459_007937 [Metarhizium acridum]